jgi:hypothetical protein
MKTLSIIVLLLLCNYLQSYSDEPFIWPVKELDTAREKTWLSNDEKDMILEINKLRYNPAQYAIQYIEWMQLYYDGKKLNLPSHPMIEHNEGIEEFNELIRVLKGTASMPVLTPSRGMTKAARILVYDQSLTGKTGHVSSGNRTPAFRLSTFGNWYGTMGEVAYYGVADPRSMLVNMLFDNGIRGKTRRNTLLNPAFQAAGISIGHHKEHEQMCSVNFVTQYVDK